MVSRVYQGTRFFRIASMKSSPRITGRDIVSEIEAKREAAKRKRRRNRCYGTVSCDCPLCR